MRRWNSLALLVALILVVAACAGGTSEETTATTGGEQGNETTTTAPPDDGGDTGEKVEIRWFIGLGAGGQPEQREAQEAVRDAFNASQDEIELVLEIVDNDVAYDTLGTQIASGNAPDIIGPVGRDGSNSFAGLYLDIEPLIESSGVDVSMWDGAAVDNQREADGTLVGLPFASFPSAMFYNKDLFDEAGLPYPPAEYGPDGTAVYGEGTEYEGTWDFDKVEEIGKILTVDANGVDATDPSFDGENTVQWGFIWQWTDRLFQQGSFWGAGVALADDGTADVPQDWEDEWHWYQDAVWESGFAPSQTEMDGPLGGNAFQTGTVAMAPTHLWYTCCIRDDANGIAGDFWDLAAMPSHNGTVTTNMHADTFRILASTEHPEEAFQTMYYLLTEAALDLLTAYGAAPADVSLTDAFLANLDQQYPQGVNWDVILASASFADNPSHETAVPGWNEYKTTLDDLQSALLSDPALDLDAAIADVETNLTTIFQENAE